MTDAERAEMLATKYSEALNDLANAEERLRAIGNVATAALCAKSDMAAWRNVLEYIAERAKPLA